METWVLSTSSQAQATLYLSIHQADFHNLSIRSMLKWPMWSASIATILKFVVNAQALIKYCHNTGAYVQYFSILALFLEHHHKHSARYCTANLSSPRMFTISSGQRSWNTGSGQAQDVLLKSWKEILHDTYGSAWSQGSTRRALLLMDMAKSFFDGNSCTH